MKLWTRLCILLVVLAALAGGYFSYMAWAFPGTRCEAAKHLDVADIGGDCYTCHRQATPRAAQEWYESKHGVTLVRCQTCHGMPDGEGALPFARKPARSVCASCHGAAIQRMEAKFGLKTDCAACHLNHQSAIHSDAYQHQEPGAQTTTL